MASGEIEFGGHTYRLGTLSAMTQMHVMRRVAPIMASAGDSENALAGMLSALGEMSDADVEYVIGKCLADCMRKQDGDAGWSAVWRSGALMFEDIGAKGMFALTRATLEANLADFFPANPSGSKAAPA